MYVNVTKNVHKGTTYYAVRIFETYYQNGKRINKVVKKIGNTTNFSEVENLKKIAWNYILEMQKDIQLSLSEIKRIRPRSPVGLMKTIERIFFQCRYSTNFKKYFSQ